MTIADVIDADNRLVVAVVVLFVGLTLGYLVGKANRRLLIAAGVPEAVEGTSFERTAQSLGTSTVALFARLTSWFVYGVALLLALQVARLFDTELFWVRLGIFIPDLFFALVVLAAGFVVGDKAELVISEWLRGFKLPEMSLLPRIAKYSVVYVAVLIALSQVGVATTSLLVLLATYAAALIVFTAVALRDVLPAAAAGIYLLLNGPYGIGDRIHVGDHTGVVQEVDVFVTHIETDEQEYIVPNHLVMREGVVREMS